MISEPSRITEGCEICDDHDVRPVPHTLSFGPLYNGICRECWLASVESGVHTVKDLPPEVLGVSAGLSDAQVRVVLRVLEAMATAAEAAPDGGRREAIRASVLESIVNGLSQSDMGLLYDWFQEGDMDASRIMERAEISRDDYDDARAFFAEIGQELFGRPDD